MPRAGSRGFRGAPCREFLGWKPLERLHNPGKLDLNQVSPKTGFYSLMFYFFVLEYIHDKLFGC